VDEELELYQNSTIDRFSESVVNDIILNTDVDDMMVEIVGILESGDREMSVDTVPLPGKFYTYVYQPKTPRIEYDEHPLIACMAVEKWGFRGLNYHWGTWRNYSWEEIVGYPYIIYPSEIKTMRQIPYQKFKLNI